jgi:hypothetical protein
MHVRTDESKRTKADASQPDNQQNGADLKHVCYTYIYEETYLLGRSHWRHGWRLAGLFGRPRQLVGSLGNYWHAGGFVAGDLVGLQVWVRCLMLRLTISITAINMLNMI